jgi:hypothetical protein
MTNGKVDAEPEAIRRLAAALTRYQRDVAEAGRCVRGALMDAQWHDPQKDRFEERYQDLQKTIDHFMEREIQDMTRRLNAFAHQLDEILNKRM